MPQHKKVKFIFCEICKKKIDKFIFIANMNYIDA